MLELSFSGIAFYVIPNLMLNPGVFSGFLLPAYYPTTGVS
jgi:hypothetical protein